MRKVAIVLGLLLVAGAIGAFGYRWLPVPGGSATVRSQWSVGQRGYEFRSAPRTREGGRRGGRDGPVLSGIQVFELVVDVLNVVIGIVGAWLAIVGMRMQRAGAERLRLQRDG